MTRPEYFSVQTPPYVHILKLIHRQTVYQSESFQTTVKMCPLRKGWVSHETDHTFITFALDGKPSRLVGWPLSWTATSRRSSKINYEFHPVPWNTASRWHTSSCRGIFMDQVGNLSFGSKKNAREVYNVCCTWIRFVRQTLFRLQLNMSTDKLRGLVNVEYGFHVWVVMLHCFVVQFNII